VTFPEAKPVNEMAMVTSQNEIGEILADWNIARTFNAEIWPLNGSNPRNEMGVTEKSTHKLFTSDIVKSNTRIVRGLETYLVGYVADWDSHRTAILEKVL